MLTPLEAVAVLESLRSGPSEVRSTGFSEIDRVSGGFRHGQVWILTGTPGQGRSMLAGQWALSLATRHDIPTQLVSLHEPIHLVAARLIASVGLIPALQVWNQDLRETDQWRIGKARDVLTAAKLLIHGPCDPSMLDSEYPGQELPEALVVDDADLAAGVNPQRIASFAARGALIILTLPRHLLFNNDGLDPVWARVADFVVDIRRPDLLDSYSPRPGEADLILVRNRWGPPTSAAVLVQPHYARFIETPEMP